MLSLRSPCSFFVLRRPPRPEVHTLSLHDALPILVKHAGRAFGSWPGRWVSGTPIVPVRTIGVPDTQRPGHDPKRSEEHTAELQSRQYLGCRLLLEEKKDGVDRMPWQRSHM